LAKIWLVDNIDAKKLNESSSGCMVGHLGIKFIAIDNDSITATMPVDHRTKQPFGLLHGGASAVLSETLGSTASSLCVDFLKYSVVGIEVNANHLKSATNGLVTGICKPVKIGRTLHIWQTKIYNEAKDLICLSRLMVMVVEAK